MAAINAPEAPEWFSVLVLISVAASFGVRDVIKNRLARKGWY